MTSKRLAQGLGWFSIALGLMELTLSRQLCRALGMRNMEWLVRAYGAREVGTGIGLLAFRNRAPWIWARVAGDALDLATLAAALPAKRKRRNVGMAIGAVAGVSALDYACARDFQTRRRASVLVRDYSDRSGFPRPAAEMRGRALASGARRTTPSNPRAA